MSDFSSQDRPPRYRDASSGSVAPAIVASIITSIVVFFALHVMEQRGLLPFLGMGKSGPSVEVPSLLGMQPDQARELLQGRELLFTLSAERDNSAYPAGTIAEQSPLPGSQVQRGSIVQAAVSRASKQVPVPSLVGLTTEEALRQLVAAGFVAGPQKTASNETVAPGKVVDTQPAPGTPLKAQGTVTLVVSSGPATKPLPKLVGMRVRAARELLEQQGFKVGKIRYTYDNDRAGGIVLDQKPSPGTPAAAGTVVELTVNED
ncbi:MAG TPA: PASTA domain-containing protein [Polyangia bacterium]